MNPDKHLVLIKGEDQTKNIQRLSHTNGKWNVQFQNGKTYRYNDHNVQWFRNPEVFNPEETVVYANRQPLSRITKIQMFKNHVRVFFYNGFHQVYPKSAVDFKENVIKNPDIQQRFEYLKRLADKVSVKDEQDASFLSKQYSKITSILPDSVLAYYLNPNKKPEIHQHSRTPIFPFGFNLSQKTAVEKALSHQISVIEGPPGTGKTQTILNIIANVVIQGKTVAVVSNNNTATANVLEKLQKSEVDFIAAYLGNNDNKKAFFEKQTGTYPDMSTWKLDTNEMKALENNLQYSGKKLNEMLEIKNKLAQLKQQLSALKLEMEYFKQYDQTESIPDYRSLYRHGSNKVLSLWFDIQQLIKEYSCVPLRYRWRNLLRYGITSFSFYQNTIENIITYLQKKYYLLKQQELENQIQYFNQKLKNYHFDEEIKKYSENSMKLFKEKFAGRFHQQKRRDVFNQDALWTDMFVSFVKEYPVILSTTHSLRNCMAENYLFDYVIMDEASQVDIVSGSLALSCAKNAVIVGDLMQLPNVVTDQLAQETDIIFSQYQLDPAYRYADNSMLSSIKKLYENIRGTLLKEHYRCHPKIIGFCNQKFYRNQLIIMTEESHEEALTLYKLSKGNHARGRYNQREIDVIKKEVYPQQGLEESDMSIGIISPYRLQVEKLRESFGKSNIEIDTVHKYQGREKDVIILSTVVNEVNDFVDNPNLINVAISRAVKKLIVLVSENEKNKYSLLGELERYIQYNNFSIIQSQIYSVFDLLYSSYSEHLKEVLKKLKHVSKSKFKSENLIVIVIENVLKSYPNLDYVMHQPLRMLIKDPKKLNDEEYRFAMNILTHTDFLIFNKIDKQPVLAVEVDSYDLHDNNPEQSARDKMKDAILKKYDIPVERLKTNGSEEELKLRSKLSSILD